MKHNAAGTPEFFSPQVLQARRFYLNLRPPPDTKLAVVCGGVEHCAPGYEIRRETFPFYSIEYVARGEGGLQLGKHRYELRPGVIFAYGPGVRQHITSNPQKPLVKYFVDFTGTRSLQWIRSAGLSPGKVSQVFPRSEIQPLFDELIRSGQRGTRHAPELCRRLLEVLGVKLVEARLPLKGADSPAFATFQKCREHVRAHFRRLRTLAEMARECHLDTAYICRLFQRYDHESPYRFLTRLKMNAAAEQLARPGALVKNVAADLGFANPYHFSRAFKAVFGIPPEKFRKMR